MKQGRSRQALSEKEERSKRRIFNMIEEEKKKESGEISRREFLKDAGLVVGGAAIGSTVLLAACGDGGVTTETVTTTTTVTETVSKFICPSCSQEFDSLAALQAHVEAEHPEAELDVVTLNVNGETHELMVDPNWTLADVLRDKLGLMGTKLSCDIGDCGFCAVIMDGRPILSCLALAAMCEGQNITTIEALADPTTGELHPIQKAFNEHHGLQCGFCTPGFIMSAKVLLDKNPNPTLDEVKEAVSGVLCRCGNYPKIFDSVLAAS